MAVTFDSGDKPPQEKKPGFFKRFFRFPKAENTVLGRAIGLDNDKQALALSGPSSVKQLPAGVTPDEPWPRTPEVVVKPWELTELEGTFKSQSKRSFRTRAFKNHALPNQPHEYLEADYRDSTYSWRITKVTVTEARALPALSVGADEQGKVSAKTSQILEGSVCAMRALHKMALFEFGTDAHSMHSTREEVTEDLTGSHFIDFAHGEHIIFDVNGHPSLTSEGKPIRNGTYPDSELQFAAKVYEDIVAEKQAAVRLIDLARLEIHSKPQSDDPMKDFEHFASIQAAAGDVAKSVGNNKIYYWGAVSKALFDSGGFFAGERLVASPSPLSWKERKSLDVAGMMAGVKSAIIAVQKLVDLANVYAEEVETNEVLRNSALSFMVHNAAFLYSGYQCYGKEFLALDTVEFAQSLAREADTLMDAFSFDDEKKKSVRAFIMQPHEPEVIANGMVKLGDALNNLRDVFHRQSLAVLEGQKPKLELPDYRNLASEFNAATRKKDARNDFVFKKAYRHSHRLDL
ncbi:hypothetical protein [Micavibrio aeruginosavorus]|uniref:hypothetical protein n=1 Tax=Micavibrio aeruginosavorus TaxID=349221 RepID=UPI003F4A922D